jgi:hypothetical protein
MWLAKNLDNVETVHSSHKPPSLHHSVNIRHEMGAAGGAARRA